MIGHLSEIVIDCPDPEALATFYGHLLGMPVARVDDDWAVIGDEADRSRVKVAFQLAVDYRPPGWPDPGRPQQIHLDIRVADIEESQTRVLQLGARRLDGAGEDFRVYADPAGHPFCLVWDA